METAQAAADTSGQQAPEGHDVAMAQKYDAGQQQQAGDNTNSTPAAGNDDQRPAWLPEKFKTPEEFAKSYDELSTKLGSQNDDANNNANTDDNNQQQQQSNSDSPNLINQAADLYAENGKLDDATYEGLSKIGIDKATVDNYIAGQEAIAQAQVAVVHNEAGGKEQYNAMIKWAAETMEDADIESFDQAIIGSDADKMMAVRDLKARYEAANGKAPNLTQGDGDSVGDIFENTAQMKAAIQN